MLPNQLLVPNLGLPQGKNRKVGSHTPRAKSDFSAAVERLKRAIRKKDDWRSKIAIPIVRNRYIEEAIAQGAQKEAILAALEELDIYENSSEDFDFTQIVSDTKITHVDGVIPEDLRSSLEQQLDQIANLPEKDFHPFSDEKVQDLIHPSLFPYIDHSKAPKTSIEERENEQNSWQFRWQSAFERPKETSIYQWLPAVFKISRDGKVTIESYINNLDQDEYPELYRDIAKIFEHLYPTIEQVVGPELKLNLPDFSSMPLVPPSQPSILGMVQPPPLFGGPPLSFDPAQMLLPLSTTTMMTSPFPSLQHPQQQHQIIPPSFGGQPPLFNSIGQFIPPSLSAATTPKMIDSHSGLLQYHEQHQPIHHPNPLAIPTATTTTITPPPLIPTPTSFTVPRMTMTMNSSTPPPIMFQPTATTTTMNSPISLLQQPSQQQQQQQQPQLQLLQPMNITPPSLFAPGMVQTTPSTAPAPPPIIMHSFASPMFQQNNIPPPPPIAVNFSASVPNASPSSIAPTNNNINNNNALSQILRVLNTHVEADNNNNENTESDNNNNNNMMNAYSPGPRIKVIESKERELQVIVKACNYILKPGQEYEGVWHVEGMSHEHIIASAIYYYASSDDLEDAGLAFREENDYDEQYGPRGQPEWSKNTPLGAIRTPAGRTIVFSNQYQHRVTRLHNKSETNIATRKILCFFIVDPRYPITSSKDVFPQQWDKVSKKQRKSLLLIAHRYGIQLPKDVVELILSFAKVGFTLEEAKEHRLELMKERKFFISSENRRLEREYSLCEH